MAKQTICSSILNLVKERSCKVGEDVPLKKFILFPIVELPLCKINRM